MKQDKRIYTNRILQLIPAQGYSLVTAWRDEGGQDRIQVSPVLAWALTEERSKDWDQGMVVYDRYRDVSAIVLTDMDGMVGPYLVERGFADNDVQVGYYRTALLEYDDGEDSDTLWAKIREKANEELNNYDKLQKIRRDKKEQKAVSE